MQVIGYYAIPIEHHSLPVTQENLQSNHIKLNVMVHDPQALLCTFFSYHYLVSIFCAYGL